MSDVKQKREEVLEKLYDELLSTNLEEFKQNTNPCDVLDGKKTSQNPKIQLIVALENARATDSELERKDRDLEIKYKELEQDLAMKSRELELKSKDLELKDRDLDLKGEALAFDNAHYEIDKEHKERSDRGELAKTIVSTFITLATNVVWGMIFVHEMQATRLFEVEGTETSAAGRWLKQSFPKVRLF